MKKTAIRCPNCGCEYLPGEIYLPNYFVGQPTDIIKNNEGEVLGYELPDEVLHELGVETITIPRTQIERTVIQKTPIPTASIDRIDYETINVTMLRRGIIGVNKVGYIIA